MELTTIRELFKDRESYLGKKVTDRRLGSQSQRFKDIWFHCSK